MGELTTWGTDVEVFSKLYKVTVKLFTLKSKVILKSEHVFEDHLYEPMKFRPHEKISKKAGIPLFSCPTVKGIFQVLNEITVADKNIKDTAFLENEVKNYYSAIQVDRDFSSEMNASNLRLRRGMQMNRTVFSNCSMTNSDINRNEHKNDKIRLRKDKRKNKKK